MVDTTIPWYSKKKGGYEVNIISAGRNGKNVEAAGLMFLEQAKVWNAINSNG